MPIYIYIGLLYIHPIGSTIDKHTLFLFCKADTHTHLKHTFKVTRMGCVLKVLKPFEGVGGSE